MNLINALKRAYCHVRVVVVLTSVAVLLNGCDQISKPAERIEQAAEGSSAAALSADGRWAIHATIHHNLALWDNETQGLRYQWQLGDQSSPVYLTRFSPNGNYVVTASDREIAIWSVTSGESIGWFTIPDSRIRDIAIDNEATGILYGLADGRAVYVERQTGRRLEFLGHQEKINAVDLSANGLYAITGSSDYSAKLWSTETAQIIQQFNHPSRVTQVRFDQQGRYVFTADSLKQARIWRIPSGDMVSNLNFKSRQQVFSAARFSADGQWLATGSPSRQLTLWHVETGQKIAGWQVARQSDNRWRSAVVYDVAFSGRWLFSVSSSGYTEAWPLPQQALQ
ncbi:hypothetical protein GCM10011369_01780 [Neiella marina]|uniref:WD40 repeat domain-containing protein n=1 Tax=Neiella marina TaxID=508461 RepID=A0A8J2U1U4_9GAMM|nr:hypothetical protein [Neiella marina]GGA64019.1 hypothetical protein GCM10011369_01780 [Neiella marina]